MLRRQFLVLAGLFALPTSLFANKLSLTPEDQEGPFYPVKAIPLRSQLILNTKGLEDQIMQLQGRILDSQGTPLSGAKIEIWQCDEKGVYDHPFQHSVQSFDKRFAGFGAQLTDKEGNYAFTTIFPVPYTGRPPHIHVKIIKDNNELLITQLYLKPRKKWSWTPPETLQIAPKLKQNGQYKAEYTFVV